ncbi:MAG: portal protein, partial [Candidatus Dormibacteria bacterium]
MTDIKSQLNALIDSSQIGEDKDQAQDDKNLILQARRHFVTTMESWSDIRKNAIEDQKFYAGEQYDTEAARAAKSRGGRPLIQVNQLNNFVQQVENNIRQLNVGINVHATDENGSEGTANILQGLIRHIEEKSNAPQAYIWAAGSHGALVPGFGFIKLETQFIGSMTFDQEICIVGCKDPMRVLPDFNAIMPDFSDAGYWFEFEQYSHDDYRMAYGDSKLASPVYGNWIGLDKALGQAWLREDLITVAKYWYKEPTIRTLAAFENGTMGYLDEYGVEIDDEGKMQIVDSALHEQFPQVELSENDQALWLEAKNAELAGERSPEQEPFPELLEAPTARPANISRIRQVVSNTICWIETNGMEILSRGEWNDSEFPYVAVIGKDQVVDGKRDIHGIVRYAKDSQKMYNFVTSQTIARIDAASKSPWIAALESIPEPQRKSWENAHRAPKAVLFYQARDSEGQPLPPPQRGDAAEPAIQAYLAAAQKCETDMKSTLGMFEATMGEAIGDRQSGIAIQTLAEKGDKANFHVSDNFTMSMKRLGYLITRLIPKIYDTARTVRIIGLDDEQELVKINQVFSANGESKQYNLADNGEYDCVVDTGPTYATKKAQESESIIEFVAANPQLGPVVADLVANLMDWDVGGKVAARILAWQAAQMPYLHAGDKMPDLPPQAKAAMNTMQQQLVQANQHIQTLNGAYQQEKFRNDTQAVAHASKERIEQVKSITALQLKKMDLLGQMLEDHNKTHVAQIKLQLEHITRTQKVHLEGLKAIDQAAGQNDQELYQNLLQEIDQVTPQGSLTGSVAPGANGATPPSNQPSPLLT